MGKSIIAQQKLEIMGDVSNNLSITYKLFENNAKYKIEVVKHEFKKNLTIIEQFSTNDITSYNQALKIVDLLVKNKVTPVSICDILEDLEML